MKKLIVLGGSRTARDVVRHANESGFEVTAASTHFDDDFQIAGASVALLTVDSRESLSRLVSMADRTTALLASSDHWLRFVTVHRRALELAFGRILHPRSPTLETCLDKAAFARFCETSKLPSPVFYPMDSLTKLVDSQRLPHPLMIRAACGSHSSNAVPKAVEVKSVCALRDMLEVFSDAGVEAVGTQSLLGDSVQQMSVGFVRSGGEWGFVLSRKLRPYPRACAAGTLAETVDPDAYPHVVDVARRLVLALDYHGMGEIEILITSDGQPHIIELNARPHLQYAMMMLAGLDVLGPLMQSHTPPVQPRFRRATWIAFRSDLYAVFSRTEGALSQGDMTLSEYVTSMLRFLWVLLTAHGAQLLSRGANATMEPAGGVASSDQVVQRVAAGGRAIVAKPLAGVVPRAVDRVSDSHLRDGGSSRKLDA